MAYRSISSWLSGTLATAAIICPVAVQAAELADWSFDESSYQLEFSLPESVIPQFFMLAEPARIVLDIPNTQVGSIATDQSFDGAVERIRVSQFDASTVRIVMDLIPGTTLDPQQADIQFDDLAGNRQWRFRPLISNPEIAVASRNAPDLSETVSPPAADTAPEATAAESSPIDGDTAESASNIPAIPSPSATQSDLNTANVNTTPVAVPVITNDATLRPEDGEGPISFSAASLQGPAPTAMPSNTLPIEVYDNPETDAVVSVPAISATTNTATAPTAPSASPSPSVPETVAAQPTPPASVPPVGISVPRERNQGDVTVPAMVAPTLEPDVVETETAVESTPEQGLATESSVAIESDLPNLETSSDQPTAAISSASSTSVPASPTITTEVGTTSEEESSTIEVPVVPAFIEATSPEATSPVMAETAPSETASPAPSPSQSSVAALNPAPVSPEQLNLESSNPQQQTPEPQIHEAPVPERESEVADASLAPIPEMENASPAPATEIEVIELPAQTTRPTQSRWPAPIQFGQPLPEDR